MSTVVISVHGFNVTDYGASTTDQLQEYYEAIGVKFIKVDYTQRIGIIRDYFTTFFTNSTVATRLNKLIKKHHNKGDIVILDGHSNAASIFWDVCKCSDHMSIPDIIMLTNPALEPNRVFGTRDQFPPVFINIFHCKSDKATELAQDMSWLVPSYLRNLKPWGRMGNIGSTSRDKRVRNYDTDYLISRHNKEKIELGHSGYYNPKYLPFLAAHRMTIVEDLLDRLNNGKYTR